MKPSLKFYSSVFKPPLNLPYHTGSITSNCLFSCFFTQNNVEKALPDLDGNKRYGPDGIPPIVLKYYKPLLAAPFGNYLTSPLFMEYFLTR